TDGQNMIGRWTHTFGPASDVATQAYIDRTWRATPGSGFGDNLVTYDVDLHHRFPLGSRQSVVWGAGYRYVRDETHTSGLLLFSPADRDIELASGFLQDEVTLIPERLRLVMGSKLEHSSYSGYEVLPSSRLAWMPAPRHTVWAAVSRSARAPSRFDVDLE